MLLTVALDHYLDWLRDERNLSPLTLQAYSKDWQAYMYWLETKEKLHPETMELEEISANQIRSYLYYMNQQGLTKATANRHLAAMKSFFKYVMRQEWLTINPVAEISLAKLQRKFMFKC